MGKKLKPIPHFKDEQAEREFWQTHDTTKYFDWSKAVRVTLSNIGLASGERIYRPY